MKRGPFSGLTVPLRCCPAFHINIRPSARMLAAAGCLAGLSMFPVRAEASSSFFFSLIGKEPVIRFNGSTDDAATASKNIFTYTNGTMDPGESRGYSKAYSTWTPLIDNKAPNYTGQSLYGGAYVQLTNGTEESYLTGGWAVLKYLDETPEKIQVNPYVSDTRIGRTVNIALLFAATRAVTCGFDATSRLSATMSLSGSGGEVLHRWLIVAGGVSYLSEATFSVGSTSTAITLDNPDEIRWAEWTPGLELSFGSLAFHIAGRSITNITHAGVAVNASLPGGTANRRHLIEAFSAHLFEISLGAQMELIRDQNYLHGFEVVSDGTVEGVLRWDDTNSETPFWTLGQGLSRSSIYGATRTDLASGAKEWATPHKTVVVGPYDAPEGRTSLTVNSMAEYDYTYRDGTVKDWPHLYFSARLWDQNTPWISQMSSLVFTYIGQLTYTNHIYDVEQGYSPQKFGAVYNVFLTIQCLKTGSPDFGKIIWFGIGVYDDRHPQRHLRILHDPASASLIYNIGINTLDPDVTMWDNQTHRITGDILPHVMDAIAEAYGRGYFSTNDPSAFKIASVYHGWEISGLSICTMRTEKISLIAHYCD